MVRGVRRLIVLGAALGLVVAAGLVGCGSTPNAPTQAVAFPAPTVAAPAPVVAAPSPTTVGTTVVSIEHCYT